jgi:Trk-type K+ transport system membrane component
MASNSQGIEKNGINAWWWGAFNSISSFANSGMSLLDANMVPFQVRGSPVVVIQGVLILAGNSAFPLFLQAILLCMKRIGRGEKAGISVLLGPKGRRVFPYMFNRRETLWLWAMLCLLNGIDWVAFEVAASTDPHLRHLSIPHRLLCGLFQAFSVRSGGFAIVSIRELDMSVQMIYIVMLYISAFPVALRYTPQYKHASYRRSLSTWEFVKFQLRGLMRAGDLRYLATAVWIITVIETRSTTDLLPIVFEVASAFGCVGVSFGAVRDGNLSLVGDWRGVSKMVLAAVMLWGRVREVRRGILKDWGQGLLDSGLEKDAEKLGIEKAV